MSETKEIIYRVTFHPRRPGGMFAWRGNLYGDGATWIVLGGLPDYFSVESGFEIELLDELPEPGSISNVVAVFAIDEDNAVTGVRGTVAPLHGSPSEDKQRPLFDESRPPDPSRSDILEIENEVLARLRRQQQRTTQSADEADSQVPNEDGQ